MGARAWKWAVAVALVLMATVGGPREVTALRCYNCNNCNKYELSQSQTCGPEDDHCMKMHMETGQVQRSCGTEEMCTNSEKEMKTHYTKVDCCKEDNCNGTSSLTPASFLLLLLLLPAVAAAPATRRLLLPFC